VPRDQQELDHELKKREKSKSGSGLETGEPSKNRTGEGVPSRRGYRSAARMGGRSYFILKGRKKQSGRGVTVALCRIGSEGFSASGE